MLARLSLAVIMRTSHMALPKRYSVLRDPVHGDIYLTHEELSVLDTPEMQRLRGIKQLGTAYLVYPGAVHTRFDHSIGCVHTTQRIIDAVNRNFELDPAGCIGVSEKEARVVRLAALVHDATHIPFGHAIEDQDGIFWRHDSAYRYERMFAASTGLGARLREIEVFEDVLSILSPEAQGASSIPSYWRELVCGTFSSDLLDYLARDAYFTGLRLSVDPRVASYFKVDRESGHLYIDLKKRELLREDILSEIVRLLEARYYFSERVYYHHAKIAAGALIARAIELLLETNSLREEDFYDATDASVLDRIEQSARDARSENSERALHLCDAFRKRRLYKRACVFPRYRNENVQEALVDRYFAEGENGRAAIEARLKDLVRFSTGREIDILVYCPEKHMQLKEARTHVRWPGVSGVRPLSEFAEQVPRLADLERSYRNLWKLYVFADTKDLKLLARVQEIAMQEFSEAHNAYDVGARA